MSTAPQFTATPNVSAVTFVNADSTTPKTLFTPGTNGARLGAISAVSDDTATCQMQLYVRISSVDYKVGTVTIAIGAGNTGGVVAQNLLSLTPNPWLDSDGAMRLPSGATVKVGPVAAVTAAKTVTLVAFGADF